mmetsp:Transcript_2225/g.3830  ORF Transcript_2225/g.3830 Transcript_2225/m.3830 type:complete len:85 (+) Transcript_2225:218-472(+)
MIRWWRKAIQLKRTSFESSTMSIWRAEFFRATLLEGFGRSSTTSITVGGLGKNVEEEQENKIGVDGELLDSTSNWLGQRCLRAR